MDVPPRSNSEREPAEQGDRPKGWSIRPARVNNADERLQLDRVSVAEQLIEVYALADELHAVTDRLRTSVGTALETLRGESA